MDDRPAYERTSSILPTSIPARKFELMVRQAMGKGPLRYSQRQAMIKTAAAMGLGRFEANLILAIEQNRQFPRNIEEPSRNWSGLFTVVCVAALQTVILLSAWLIYHS